MAIAYQCLCAGSTAFVIYDDESSIERRGSSLISQPWLSERIDAKGRNERHIFHMDDGEKKLQSYQMQMMIHLQREDSDEAMFV